LLRTGRDYQLLPGLYFGGFKIESIPFDGKAGALDQFSPDTIDHLNPELIT
jgi:hypothetical protein